VGGARDSLSLDASRASESPTLDIVNTIEVYAVDEAGNQSARRRSTNSSALGAISEARVRELAGRRFPVYVCPGCSGNLSSDGWWRLPIFEYRCRACDERFEALVLPSMQDAPACPSCNSLDLEKMLSLFAVDSEGTRQSARAAGVTKARATKRDRLHAEREYRKTHQH
jgi:putative FmdB family regulatory protein